MKVARYLLVVAFLVSALGFVHTNVNAADFSSYSSGIQLQNLSTSQAIVTLTYYKSDGSIDTTFNDPDPIPALGSRTYFPVQASSGFTGSVVISSSQPLAAVSNILGYNGSVLGADSFIALTSGSTTLSLPLLMDNNSGIYTWYSVQNIGTATANVSIAYSDGTATATVQIPVGSSHTFYQEQETHNSAVFSGIVTSDQNVVASVIQENGAFLLSYDGFSSASTNPIFPLINTNNNGIQTGIQIQNVSATDTTVTVTYTPSTNGTACTETQIIPANSSKTFALYPFAGVAETGITTTCIKEKFIGSAQVTDNSASAQLEAVDNQFTGTSGGDYSAFNLSQATNTVVFPLIMDRNGVWWTGFSIMNVGSSTTDVSCTFTGTSYTFTANALAPGQSAWNIQYNQIASHYVGSATCTASGSGQIVGIVNEDATSLNGDGILTYEGINITPAG